MHSLNVGKSTKEKPTHQRAKNHADAHDELIGPSALSHNNIVHLQRLIGNQGVQRLLTQEAHATSQARQSQHTTGLPTLLRAIQPKTQPDIQRCSCGGTCAKCQHEQEKPITIPQLQRELVIQRWWDDEEEEIDDKSWWDEAVETVTEAGGSAYDAVTETAGGVWDTVTETASDAWDSASETAGDVWDTVKEGASNVWGQVSGESDTPESEESSPESNSDVILLPAAAVVALLLAAHQAGRWYFEDQMKPVPATKLTDKDLILPPQFCFDDKLNAGLLAVDDERARVDPLIDKALANVKRIPLGVLAGLISGGMIGLLGTKTPVAALVTAGIGAVAGLLASIADAHKDVIAANEAIEFYNLLVDELNTRWNDYYACRMGLPSDCENPAFTTAPVQPEA